MRTAGILRSSPPRLLQELTRPWAPDPGDHVICAVSGGADSVALACLLAALAPGRGWNVKLATVDHGLRGKAGADDACSVESLGVRLGLDVHRLRASLPAGASEAAARSARHGLLEALAADLGARAIALAHTMDDQAETLLHRLARGTGTAGAAGMLRWRFARWRPLLRVRRTELRTLLEGLGMPWREDETNQGPQATRNRIRHLALPGLARAMQREVVPALARAAELSAEDEALLARLAEEALVDVVLARDADGVECDLSRLAALEGPLRSRVLRRLLAAAPWFEGELTRAHVDALDRLVGGGGPGTHVDLPGVCAADRRGRRLFLGPTPVPPAGS